MQVLWRGWTLELRLGMHTVIALHEVGHIIEVASWEVERRQLGRLLILDEAVVQQRLVVALELRAVRQPDLRTSNPASRLHHVWRQQNKPLTGRLSPPWPAAAVSKVPRHCLPAAMPFPAFGRAPA